jgi:Lipopolysaccharide assembly protein A domain
MRILRWLVLIPLGAMTVYLALANRHHVLFSLDPFNPEAPALALDISLFYVVLLSVFLGILIGGTSTWRAQGKWRKEARKGRRDMKRLSDEVVETSENLPVPAVSTDRKP